MKLDGLLDAERVGMCQSGGLSALAVGGWLVDRGVQVTQFVADLGQDPPQQVRQLAAELERRGLRTVLVDLRKEMAATAAELVRFGARYEGGYWNTTGAARCVLVAGLVEPMRRDGCTVLAHGCVAGGNDHRRFLSYTTAHAPDLRLFVPWTDPDLLERFPDRAAMARYVAAREFPLDRDSAVDSSVDANLAGVSYEATTLEDLRTPSRSVRLRLASWPQDAPAEGGTVRVGFERGRPTAIDGRPLPLAAILQRANQLAGAHGVGIVDTVENRINGTKCRGLYEAPGVELLARCLGALYSVTLDERGHRLYGMLAAFLGRQVYEGRYAEPASTAARVALESLAERATGTVQVDLYKGNVQLRALYDYPASAGTARQRRLQSGGNVWQTEAVPAARLSGVG